MSLQHINTLDPDINSVTDYRSFYNNSENLNPVVIHHLVPSEAIVENDTFLKSEDTNSTLENIPTVLYGTGIDSVEQQLMQIENSANIPSDQSVSHVSKEGVEILITDQATGDYM